MKTQVSIGIAVAAAVLTAFLLLSTKQKGHNDPLSTATGTTAGSSEESGSAIAGEDDVQSAEIEDQTKPEGLLAIEKKLGRKLTSEEIEQKPEEAPWVAWGLFLDQHRIKTSKNGSILFFGRVVDESGDPVEGVSIQAEVSFYLESIAEKLMKEKSNGRKQFEISTDENGWFKISDQKGDGLELFDFTKAGWELAGEKQYWGYSFVPNYPQTHKPDPENPVEFVMRKTDP